MMRIAKFAALLLALSASITTPAAAQSSLNEDVRCVVLSNLFAKTGSTPQNRQVASQTLLFYLGRLDGRASGAAISSAMRAQSQVDRRTAPSEMLACAQKLAQAQRNLQTWGRDAAGAQKGR